MDITSLQKIIITVKTYLRMGLFFISKGGANHETVQNPEEE